MAAGAHDQATMNRYAAAQARLEHAGGYGWRDHATAVLRGLGFAEEHLERPLRTFSGGELTRASLARALGGDPDLLLLDEPTNHLDVASLEWLERELNSLDAAIILVAHDRWFLEAVTTGTLEVVAGRGTFFPGPWHNWRREKAARMLARAEGCRARPVRHRAPRALRRAVPLQEVEGEAGSGEAHADRPARAGAAERERGDRAPLAQAALARLRVPEAGAERPRRDRGRRPRRAHRRARAAARRDVRARPRRARRARRAERLRQDDAARDDPRPPRRGGRAREARARRRGRRTSRSRSSSSTRAAACSSACRR